MVTDMLPEEMGFSSPVVSSATGISTEVTLKLSSSMVAPFTMMPGRPLPPLKQSTGPDHIS